MAEVLKERRGRAQRLITIRGVATKMSRHFSLFYFNELTPRFFCSFGNDCDNFNGDNPRGRKIESRNFNKPLDEVRNFASLCKLHKTESNPRRQVRVRLAPIEHEALPNQEEYIHT